MIISASRRTDIPSFYSNWFYNRIKEGFVLVRNPMNFHRISSIKLSPEVVDGIVFWTKNPIPMLERLDELRDYMYYFQFTITPYGKDIEQNILSKNDKILSGFKRLSEKIGVDRVIWRYDPIFISAKYSHEYHIHAFGTIINQLRDYTRKVTISFIDVDYRNIKRNLNELSMKPLTAEKQIEIGSALALIAHENGLKIDTCAEKINLKQFGIEHAHCIDEKLFESLLNCSLDIDKDKNQRLECGCVSSIDIGMYNTCCNGCLYCYANYNSEIVMKNAEKHNPLSPLISGIVEKTDTVSERKVKSCCTTPMKLDIQMRLDDL